MSSKRISELEKLLASDPTSDAFAELAELLCENAEKHATARELCFRGLTHHPKSARGRLVLARLFYLSGYPEFCVRELERLNSLVSSQAVVRLLGFFNEYRKETPSPSADAPAGREGLVGSKVSAKASGESADSMGGRADDDEDFDVLAEIDIDADFIDALDELDKD